ncbi:MAG: hypothetical protein ACLPZR_22890 [Solirubrobacteraceae bacterium]
MRIDLQYLYRANPKAFVAAGAVIAACFAVLIVKGLAGTSSGHAQLAAHTRPAATTSTRPTIAEADGVTTPNSNYHPAYATNVPSSPIDATLASEFGASGSSAAALEAVTPAPPAWTTAYPAMPASDMRDEQSYAVAFLEELLDRDYRTQSRSDLARWVSAESADEMFPGVPAEAGDHALYGELLEPAALGAPFTVVPSATGWASEAAAGVTQHVYGLLANPDSTWSELVGKGFTSPDPLMGAEDVTGVIATTRGGKTTKQHFAAEVLLGSALHHPGYGSFGLAQWEVN